MAAYVSATGWESFRQVTNVNVLGHRHYGGLLKTCWYYRLGQGEVENVSEDACQLVSACSQYTSW